MLYFVVQVMIKFMYFWFIEMFQRASISSLEAGIPTANEFLALTDIDADVDSDDDLQKGVYVSCLFNVACCHG